MKSKLCNVTDLSALYQVDFHRIIHHINSLGQSHNIPRAHATSETNDCRTQEPMNFDVFSKTTAPLRNVAATFYSMGRSGNLRHCGSVGSQSSLFGLLLKSGPSLNAANQPSRKTVERYGACFISFVSFSLIVFRPVVLRLSSLRPLCASSVLLGFVFCCFCCAVWLPSSASCCLPPIGCSLAASWSSYCAGLSLWLLHATPGCLALMPGCCGALLPRFILLHGSKGLCGFVLPSTPWCICLWCSVLRCPFLPSRRPLLFVWLCVWLLVFAISSFVQFPLPSLGREKSGALS